MKTIKQIAEELGVSKTAIRNYMTEEFRAKYTAKNEKGVITITPDGCKVIAESFAKTPESNRKEFAETELVTIPRSVLATYEDQLRQKDVQLAEKDLQIKDLTETVKSQAQSVQSAQALHAGTMQKLGAGSPAHGEESAIDVDAAAPAQEDLQEESDPVKAGKLKKIWLVIRGKL